MSLTHGLIPFLVPLLAVLIAVASARVMTDVGRRRSTAALAATLVLVGAVAVGHRVAGWIAEPIPASYYVALLLPVFGACLAVASALPRRAFGARSALSPDPWPRRVVALVGAVLLVPAGVAVVALRVNATYDYYPTVASLGGGLGSNVTSLAEVQRRASAHGPATTSSDATLLTVAIPGARSHFHARHAYVWLPPAYFASKHHDLPVLLLLHGVPGQPSDWARAGGLVRTARAYSEAHHGRGPIVVMPDINGSLLGDSECVNSPKGDVETYLTQDVPAFVHHALGDKTWSNWSVAGLSEGGTCAAMLALRHPSLFDAFGDFSGLIGPTVGTSMNPPATIRKLFAGSVTAYRDHSPLWLLEHRPPHDVRAVFAVGNHDAAPLYAQRTLAARARLDHLPTTTIVLHGGHDWYLWQTALRRTFSPLNTPPVGVPGHRTGPRRSGSRHGPRPRYGHTGRGHRSHTARRRILHRHTRVTVRSCATPLHDAASHRAASHRARSHRARSHRARSQATSGLRCTGGRRAHRPHRRRTPR